MVELLAPAGDIEKLKMAFHYGADAVYVGGRDFSLRANAKNFSLEELEEATKYTHSLNKKIYVTVNIIFHNDNFDNLEEYLVFLNKIKVDGVIVSDIAVIDMIKRLGLDLFIVLSTQNSTLNVGTVRFFQNLGVKRIVMARESSAENIKRIIDETGIEIETFIHGAMCTSISGKCVLSNYLTNRDSNRGGCVQACRWCYKVLDKPEFTMTSKDLNMINNIEAMINMGIVSFKIEGRMRSVYYIATVILAYRKMIDAVLSNSLTEEDKKYYLNILNRCANRDSKEQFFNELPTYEDQYYTSREEKTNQDFLGIVLDYDENTKICTIEQRNYIKVGDEIQFFGPNIETFNYKVHKMYDEDDNIIEIANHPRMIIKLPVSTKLNKFDMLRVKIFDKNNNL